LKNSSLVLKKIFFLTITAITFFCINGCKKEDAEKLEKEERTKRILQNLTSEINTYNLCGKADLSNVDKYYFPEELKLFLKQTIIIDGQRLLYAEQYNRQILGTIESSLFYDESDSGYWVDALLIHLEEERIAGEINTMEEDLVNADNDSIKDEAEEIEKMLSNEIASNEIVSKDSNLLFMEYEDEIFIPQKTADGWNIIQSINGKVKRTKYDFQYRAVEKENWDIPSAENATLLSKETFNYYKNSYKIKNKIIEGEDSLQSFFYNKNGLINKIENYKLIEDKKHLLNRTKRSYDDQDRILSDERTDYVYKNEYAKLDYKFTKKYVYIYNENEELPPDFDYFENGVLKMKNRYADRKGTYTSQIFFEGGFSVKTLYVDDIRSRDIYYLNNEVTRIKVYEK